MAANVVASRITAKREILPADAYICAFLIKDRLWN